MTTAMKLVYLWGSHQKPSDGRLSPTVREPRLATPTKLHSCTDGIDVYTVDCGIGYTSILTHSGEIYTLGESFNHKKQSKSVGQALGKLPMVKVQGLDGKFVSELSSRTHMITVGE
eukprot:GFYU01006972.1.p1 GENE.GFYU01006972.1~~GFYU01006972.1.p1  ORF type:complete len:116 (+),score=9.98 GFYU01006972.1:343-690(+)